MKLDTAPAAASVASEALVETVAAADDIAEATLEWFSGSADSGTCSVSFDVVELAMEFRPCSASVAPSASGSA